MSPVLIDFRELEPGDIIVIAVPPHLHTIEPFGFTVISPGMFWKRYTGGQIVLEAFPPGTQYGFIHGFEPATLDASLTGVTMMGAKPTP